VTTALVLADDFTGAMDTGHSFAVRGYSVRVFPEEPAACDADPRTHSNLDVLAIDMDTRDVEPQAAAAAVRDRLASSASSPVVYKKIDSTLRGNVVPEVDAALDATGSDLAIVAPAFPSTGRVTVAGRHLVDGRPLEEAGYDSQSDLRSLFERSDYEVAVLGLETILEGPAAVRSEFESRDEGGPTIVVCDAVHDRHLRTIATGAESIDGDVLFVGSGGLAQAVSLPGEARPSADAVTAGNEDGVLAVVGSVNDRTLEQLDAVSDELVFRLDPAAAVADPAETGRSAAADLETVLRTRGRAVVTGATSTADVDRANEAAARGVDPGERVATALGSAAGVTVTEVPLSGLFLTGGSIARAVLDELSATAIDLTGDAVVDGVPEGRIVDGPAAGTAIVTKAGGFGDRRSIVNCLTFLDRTDDRD
jgi:D-threonate/D-erythronate kinase